MKAELDIKPFLKAINEFRTPEQQPFGVQVVKGVGLVAFFRTVFAEEFGDFFFGGFDFA
jgi:hypothetical protein